MISSTVSGHFIDGRQGKLFLLVRQPEHPTGCVLFVPPFAEEMNKCRRMISETAMELSSAGHAVLVPDLYGTGDSEGEFHHARWSCWEENLADVCAWSSANRIPVTSIIAVRLGAALALTAAARGVVASVRSAVFWEPVFDGRRHLTQFLRLRTAAKLIGDDRKETVDELRSKLSSGMTLEVAGYRIGSDLAADLDGLTPPLHATEGFGSLYWMEVVPDGGGAVSSAAARLREQMERTGRKIAFQAFAGEPFWATVEVARVREMIHASVRALSNGRVN